MPTEIKPAEDICRQIAGEWKSIETLCDLDWQIIKPSKFPQLYAIETAYEEGVVNGYATEHDFREGEPTHKFAIRITLEPV